MNSSQCNTCGFYYGACLDCHDPDCEYAIARLQPSADDPGICHACDTNPGWLYDRRRQP